MSDIIRLTDEEIVNQMRFAPTNDADISMSVDKVATFNATAETMFADSKTLEKIVAAYLKTTLCQLEYVSIGLNDGTDQTIPRTIPYGEFFVNLYFSPGKEGETKYIPKIDVVDGKEKVVYKFTSPPYNSLRAIDGPNKNVKPNAMLDKLYAINGQSRNRCAHYQVNNITKQLLGKYAFEDPKRIDWRMHVAEINDTSNIYSNNGNYFVGVIGLSLGKFIDDIFGGVDDEGGIVDYKLNLVRNISGGYYPGNRNFIIAIHKMSRDAVRRLAEMTNSYPGQQVSLGTRVRDVK